MLNTATRASTMHPLLDKNLFLIKEHVGVLKAANEFDVFDPESGAKVLECREPTLGTLAKLFRFTDYKRMTPFDIVVRDTQGQVVLRVRRGVSLFLSKVQVFDGNDRLLGGFDQKLFSIGGRFDVLDERNQPLCTLQGRWTSWEFRFFAPQRDYAIVTKKWAGIGRELFTSADNYIVQIKDGVPAGDPARPLILAAVLVIDMVLKE
jgi:uncharacterized protein YxjI